MSGKGVRRRLNLKEIPKTHNFPHPSVSEATDNQNVLDDRNNNTMPAVVDSLSHVSLSNNNNEYLQSAISQSGILQSPPPHVSYSDAVKYDGYDVDDSLEDFIRDCSSLDNSGTSFMSWNDEFESNITTTAQTQFDQIDQLIYSENENVASTLPPNLVKECRNWKEKIPHLRVVGQRLNLFETDEKMDILVPEEECREELIASHGDYEEDDECLDSELDKTLVEESEEGKDVSSTKSQDDLSQLAKSYVKEELFTYLWNESMDFITDKVKAHIDSMKSDEACALLPDKSRPSDMSEFLLLASPKQKISLSRSRGESNTETVGDPDVEQECLPDIFTENVHKDCRENKYSLETLDSREQTKVKISGEKLSESSPLFIWSLDRSVEKTTSDNMNELPESVIRRRGISRRITPVKVTENAITCHVVMEGQLDSHILRLFIGSWNVNGRPPTIDLSDWLARDPEPPDIYVIGFQELLPYTVILSCALREEEWRKAVINALHPRASYNIVAGVRLCGIMLLVFAQEKYGSCVRDVATDTVGTGVMNRMGDKGAVGVSFDFHNTSFCFVNAHLAAHMEEYEKRNQDYHDICARMTFTKSYPQTIDAHDQIYWFGDLNYRVTDSKVVGDVKEILKTGDFETVLQFDQLRQQRKKKKAFVGYREGKIMFPPTYKYDPGTDDWDSSEKKRVPAWCDRVLWKGDAVTHVVYRSHPKLKMSDHKPVSCLFDSKVRSRRHPVSEMSTLGSPAARTNAGSNQIPDEPPGYILSILGERVGTPVGTGRSGIRPVKNYDIEHHRTLLRKGSREEKNSDN